MVRTPTMLVGEEGAVQSQLGSVWSESRVSCGLAATDVVATGTEWRQTTHQSCGKRNIAVIAIGSQEGNVGTCGVAT